MEPKEKKFTSSTIETWWPTTSLHDDARFVNPVVDGDKTKSNGTKE